MAAKDHTGIKTETRNAGSKPTRAYAFGNVNVPMPAALLKVGTYCSLLFSSVFLNTLVLRGTSLEKRLKILKSL